MGDLESLNDTIVSISRQIDAILADNFVTTNEIAELQQNVTEFSGDLQTLDDEVETLFLINKTELIRQLNVPIDALIEIVDEIVVSSNRNFDEVKAEIATLERNVSRQYQYVLSRMRDGGLVTGVGGGRHSLPISAPGPPGGTGPSAQGTLPAPPGSDRPSAPGTLVSAPGSDSPSAPRVCCRCWTGRRALRYSVCGMTSLRYVTR